MSDKEYFFTNYSSGETYNGFTIRPFKVYSDKATSWAELLTPYGGYKPELMNPNAPYFDLSRSYFEYEISEKYIVYTVSVADGVVSRWVFRGDFTFQGSELTEGVISEAIMVENSGEVVEGYRLASPVKVIPSSKSDRIPDIGNFRYNKMRYDAGLDSPYGAYTEITTTQGFEQFFPAGWASRPFEDNLISVGKVTGGSGSSSGTNGSSTTQTLITTSAVDTLTGIKKKQDTFKFDADPTGQVDKVTGFKAKEKDVLSISKSAFDIDRGTFAIAKNAKVLGKRLRSNVDVVYYIKTGELILNANGRKPGFGDDGGVFAVLMGKPTVGSGSVQFY